jgi:hypothetical protein
MKAPSRALRPALPAIAALILLYAASALGGTPDSGGPRPHRGIRAFQPKPGETADEPSAQLVQVLLDRQDKGDYDSYMVQVLFRGKPPERTVRVRDDRIEIDFLDTGKPGMRLARIRGGVVEASSLEEFYYRSPAARPQDGTNGARTKRLVRLTLFTKAKPELRFRDTLDRTLIHFRMEKPRRAGN